MSDIQHNDTPPQTLDVYTKSNIYATAKIAGIAALISIAGAVIGAIANFVNPKTTPGALKEGFENGGTTNFGTSVFTVLFSLVINGILFYYLYRFSKISKAALENNQNIILETGLFSLATYFRVCAILMIVSAGFIIVAFLAVGLGSAFK